MGSHSLKKLSGRDSKQAGARIQPNNSSMNTAEKAFRDSIYKRRKEWCSAVRNQSCDRSNRPFQLAMFGLGIAICIVLFGQASAKAQDSEGTLKVDVKLVNVFVTVTDASGAPVPSLQKENFVLKEDGHEQKIAIFAKESSLPLSIVLAVDTSLSTRKDLPLELISARKFAHAIVRPQDGLALYKFSEEVNELVPFTSDLKKIDSGIDRIRNGSATALYDAVYLGSQALSRRQGRKVMVVITDGGDTVSQTKYPEALRAAQESEAIIYSVIIVPIEASAGRDTGGEHALIQISSDTGGKLPRTPTRATLPACCAPAASGAARRPPASVPRNARRVVTG